MQDHITMIMFLFTVFEMPRHFIRKSARGRTSKDQMELAVVSVTEGGQSIRKAAAVHDVNYKTVSPLTDLLVEGCTSTLCRGVALFVLGTL